MTTSTSSIPNLTTPALRWAPERSLRLVLRANATTSALFGLVGAIGAGYWSDRLGVDHVAITLIVSIGLVLFAADVLRISRLPTQRLRSASLQVSIADMAWVAATIVVVALGLLNTFGVVAALIVAVGVADFALAQLWFRRLLNNQA